MKLLYINLSNERGNAMEPITSNFLGVVLKDVKEKRKFRIFDSELEKEYWED